MLPPGPTTEVPAVATPEAHTTVQTPANAPKLPPPDLSGTPLIVSTLQQDGLGVSGQQPRASGDVLTVGGSPEPLSAEMVVAAARGSEAKGPVSGNDISGAPDHPADQPKRGVGSQSGAVQEEDGRSHRGSTGGSENESSGYGTEQARMPRNFRIAMDGYTLCRDEDGTYCAYRINVTAGLHQWHVLRRYRQFLSLHQAVAEQVRREDMPHLPGKRILGSSVDPSFAEARGLALQVYLRQLVCVSAAWRVPQLIGFLDERASMMGVQSQISDVLDQVDRTESLCVDLQHQLNLSQMQVKGQNELVETLCRRLQQLERDYAALSEQVPAAPSNDAFIGDVNPSSYPAGVEGSTPRRRASTGQAPSGEGYFGSSPGMVRRMSSIAGGLANAGGFGGPSLPPAKIDMSDLNNLVKRVESANQLAMKVASDDEDDAVDQLLEQQHQIMRSSSAYSLASNPECNGQQLQQRMDRRESTDFFYMGSIDTGGITQGIKGLLEGDEQDETVESAIAPNDDNDNNNDDRNGGRGGTTVDSTSGGPRRTSAVPITIPVPEGAMPSKVWERLRKGGSLLGDPEERMMAEGQDGNTPGSGLVKDVSRSMFGLTSPPCPPNAPRWSTAGLSTLSAMFGIGNNSSGSGNVADGAVGGKRGSGKWEGDEVGDSRDASVPRDVVPAGPSEAEDDPLPLDILPCNRQPLAIDRRVDDLLRLLRPAARAERYRRSVFRFVTRQVKRALGAQCFPVGGYAIQAYLPDEEVGISAFLCHGQEKSWFVRVNETLCKVSSEASEEASEGTGTGEAGEEQTGGGAAESEEYRHRLSNVNFINMGNLQRIKCVVDNQVAVDIGANQVGDIATVALLEETDQLLGKNHLFKRSLLLIKSWWVYESRAYTGSNMLSRITEAALATMVLAVVNQHHARLHTPLQVMALFFHMQSHFDWSRYCWCIEGARRLDTLHINISSSDGASSHGDCYSAEAFGGLAGHPAPLLLSQEVLNRYRLRHAGRARQRSQAQGGRKSPVIGGPAPPSAGEQRESSGGGVAVGPGAVTPGGVCGSAAEGTAKEDGVRKFPIRNMNVMNPLDSSDNQIDDTVNRRRAARMHSLLQMGARQLRPVLTHLKREVTKAQQGQPAPPHPGYLHTTSVAMLETFFALSWARFGQGWRPDVPPHLDRDSSGQEKVPWSMYDHDYSFCGTEGLEAHPPPTHSSEGANHAVVASSMGNSKHRDPFHVDLQSVRDSVKYCCFLLEAEVTDSALLALSREILSDKGSLPVGEIGKLLQEATANASLSQTLKDQFGGLKKFLEKYPGEFVIAADHPFNPHVYLKSALTPEELDTVLRGGTVLQAGTGGGGGGKKHKKSARRRSGAHKSAGQVQQQLQGGQTPVGAMLHSAGGSSMVPQQQQQQPGHMRAGHAQMTQQQQQLQQHREEHQQQMRALDDQVYLQQQGQQDSMHGLLLDSNPSMLGQREQQQKQHSQPQAQQQGLVRQQGQQGGNTRGVSIPHAQQPHQPQPQLHHASRSSFSTVGPPRIPTRAESMQRPMSSPPGQRLQHHQQQQQQQQQGRRRQQQEEALTALYLQQSAETLAAGDPYLNQQRGGANSDAGFPRGGRLISDPGMPGMRGGVLGQDSVYPSGRDGHQQRQHDLRGQVGGVGVDVRWEDMPRDRALQQLKDLRAREGGVGEGAASRNDRWGGNHNPPRQELDIRGQGGMGRGVDPRLQGGGGGGLGSEQDSSRGLLYKTLQLQQQQQQQPRQGRDNSSRLGSGLDGFLGDIGDYN